MSVRLGEILVKESLITPDMSTATGNNDYKVDKYVIPAGSLILMSQYMMHHHSRYFSDPDVVYPDRWTKGARLHLPRFSYFWSSKKYYLFILKTFVRSTNYLFTSKSINPVVYRPK